jgi:Uma2 family endonuclease
VEFHRRYEASPPDVRAELIGGIVYMPSPLKVPHGTHASKLNGLLVMYEAATPGIQSLQNTTAILGQSSEPQPDLALRLLPERAGQSRENRKRYLIGAPELIIEVAHSSVAIDLHAKKDDYRDAGVREYLVLCLQEQELRAFDLPADEPWPLPADRVFRSRVFPGLWIDEAATIAEDLRKLLATLRRGLKSAEHAAFVRQLQPARVKRKRPRGR